jgi:hypothetical protein
MEVKKVKSLMYFLNKNEYRLFKCIEIIRRGLREKEQK